MKNKFVLFGVVSILVSMFFGGIAYQQLMAENMDEVYLNIGYCTLFLSIAVYLWHAKKENQKDNN